MICPFMSCGIFRYIWPDAANRMAGCCFVSPHKKSFRTIFFLICEKKVKNFVKNLVVSEKRCTFAPANAARDT